jgi:ketosteroid isomerase-like protein
MKYATLFLFISLLYGCGKTEKFLSEEKINQEKQEVLNVLKSFNQANEEENFSKMVPYLADEVIFFGTDSSEVIRTFAEYKDAITRQWQEYDRISYGEMKDINIEMNNTADFCSVIYGMPCEVVKNGISEKLFLRVSRTLKKTNDNWVIVTGITGIPRDDKINYTAQDEQ